MRRRETPVDLYRFGDCELDAARRELRRAGRVVAIEPKVFQVLQHLLAHADTIVAKEQLLAAVWPGTRVNEIAIARCISAARLAIGDRRGPQALIRTVHGIGYRFAGMVAREGDDGAAAPGASPGGGRDGAAPRASSGERKQVSVLCAALPALGAPDLDERHALMLQIEAIAQAAIRGFGGTILALSERGVLAVFGAPSASEHHAADAFMAARELLARWSGAADAGGQAPPAIGIDSGPCVVERRPPPLTLAIIGDAVAGAETLARQGAPGEIVASARSASRLGRVRADPAHAAVALRIVGDGEAPAASSATGAPSDARFVGRVAELSTLDTELQGARRGVGRVVCVTGEPGIGKSRLLRQFLAGLPPTHVNLVTGHCQSFGRTTPLLPLRAVLLDLIGGGDTTDATALGKALDRQLARLAIDHPPFRTALRHLLGIDPLDEALVALGPAAVRARSFAALHEIVMRLARQRPTVLLIEDVHWIDATSEAYLAALIERMRNMRLLLVVTRRPGAEPDWARAQGVTQIVLGPLPPQDAVRLVQAIWSDRLRTLALADALVARSGGNPFFLEELTQVAMHEGGGRAEVPQNVEAVIAARIDQLPPRAKQVLQAAAVLGTEVAHALLQPLVAADEAGFRAALEELSAADFLRQSPGAGEPTLVFKHVLTREVAYGSLLARERRRLHGVVATMLGERFPELALARPELVAQHAAAAALHAEAAEAWTRAADRAMARSAYTEALSDLRLGLGLVERIAETDRRQRVELRLRLMLGQVLGILRGFTDGESADSLEAARALCRRVDDPVEIGRVLRAIWPVYFARARYDAVLEIGAALRQSAERAGQLGLVSSAEAALGATRFFLGDFAAAARLLADGVRDGLEAQRADPNAPRGMDFVVFGESYLARVNWLLGAPAAALAGCARAVAAAEAADNPWLRVQALYFTGLVHQYRRDAAAAGECATRLLAVAEENEFRYWILLGRLLRGWCRERAGEAGGIAEIEAAIAGLERMGTVIGRPYFLVHLAELKLARRDVDGARAALDRAIAVSEETGERVWDSEQSRLAGDILAAQAGAATGRAATRLRAQAAAAYATAHADAVRRGAPSLALRALLSAHALEPRGAAARRIATKIATLLARIDGDRSSPDLVAAARIVGTRRNSAGKRSSARNRR